MNICVAQTRPLKGNIQGNIERHKALIDMAISLEADMIIFPELSLTGYEPRLAKKLATHQQDNQLDDFQTISDRDGITIGVGMPTKQQTGICISMFIFQPHKPRQLYSKKYIHADEEPFFISGENFACLNSNNTNIGLAICYELSIPRHAADAFQSGAKVYIASVAKTAHGVDMAMETLSGIASKYSMTVLMSNATGECDGEECGGKTSIWNNRGLLVGQLSATVEGVLVIDTVTGEIRKKTVHA